MSDRQTHRIVLAALAILFALFSARVFYFANNFMVPPPPHFVTDTKEWPDSLQKMIGNDIAIADSIQVYEIYPLPDTKSVWLVKNHDEFIDALIQVHKLNEIAFDHPKLSELIESLPHEWGNLDVESSGFHATSGFGSIHQEGVDLFVVARDRKSSQSVYFTNGIFRQRFESKLRKTLCY